MNPNLGQAIFSASWLSSAMLAALVGCGADDPEPAPGPAVGSPTASSSDGGTVTGAGTVGAATNTSFTSTATTSGTTTTTAADTTAATATTRVETVTSTTAAGTMAATAASGTGTSSATTTVTSTTTAGAGGNTSTTSTDGGAELTDEQCQGISSNAMCSTPGNCAPRACGIADSGMRTCTCATTWDCTSCAWTMPYSPHAEPPNEPLPSCEGVEEDAACTEGDPRCMLDDELCVCWVQDGNGAWDCDNPPSFWE